MVKPLISVLIPSKNEGEFLTDCLASVVWADEVIVLDNGSTDNTTAIVNSFPSVKILTSVGGTYATRKNLLAQQAKGRWLLYIDADERVTPLLKQEIDDIIHSKTTIAAYAIPRRQILLGKELSWGGWGKEDSYVMRLFQASKLLGFEGDLHEQPRFPGDFQKMKEPLIHLQPETLEVALAKSIQWTTTEAEQFVKPGINHPPIVWWRVIRMGLTTLYQRLISKKAFNDGMEGVIEAVYQSYHTMIVYLRLWELQLNLKRN